VFADVVLTGKMSSIGWVILRLLKQKQNEHKKRNSQPHDGKYYPGDKYATWVRSVPGE